MLPHAVFHLCLLVVVPVFSWSSGISFPGSLVCLLLYLYQVSSLVLLRLTPGLELFLLLVGNLLGFGDDLLLSLVPEEVSDCPPSVIGSGWELGDCFN